MKTTSIPSSISIPSIPFDISATLTINSIRGINYTQFECKHEVVSEQVHIYIMGEKHDKKIYN